jgi:hypothetical protein
MRYDTRCLELACPRRSYRKECRQQAHREGKLSPYSIRSNLFNIWASDPGVRSVYTDVCCRCGRHETAHPAGRCLLSSQRFEGGADVDG